MARLIKEWLHHIADPYTNQWAFEILVFVGLPLAFLFVAFGCMWWAR